MEFLNERSEVGAPCRKSLQVWVYCSCTKDLGNTMAYKAKIKKFFTHDFGGEIRVFFLQIITCISKIKMIIYRWILWMKLLV